LGADFGSASAFQESINRTVSDWVAASSSWPRIALPISLLGEQAWQVAGSICETGMPRSCSRTAGGSQRLQCTATGKGLVLLVGKATRGFGKARASEVHEQSSERRLRMNPADAAWVFEASEAAM
jgi:hypothetical protein